MEYRIWRDEVFGQSENEDPVLVELKQELYELSEKELLDHIDRSLKDNQIHSLYSRKQIGIGLNIIFNNSCSDIPFCYVEDEEKLKNEARKIEAIKNLKLIYENFFEKYCEKPILNINDINCDDRIDYLCYMLWDLFVLYPGNATTEMVNAALNVMKSALHSRNEYCVVSAIHGLGHWVSDSDAAKPMLLDWLKTPTTENIEIIKYANQAQTGYIQ